MAKKKAARKKARKAKKAARRKTPASMFEEVLGAVREMRVELTVTDDDVDKLKRKVARLAKPEGVTKAWVDGVEQQLNQFLTQCVPEDWVRDVERKLRDLEGLKLDVENRMRNHDWNTRRALSRAREPAKFEERLQWLERGGLDRSGVQVDAADVVRRLDALEGVAHTDAPDPTVRHFTCSACHRVVHGEPCEADDRMFCPGCYTVHAFDTRPPKRDTVLIATLRSYRDELVAALHKLPEPPENIGDGPDERVGHVLDVLHEKEGQVASFFEQISDACGVLREFTPTAPLLEMARQVADNLRKHRRGNAWADSRLHREKDAKIEALGEQLEAHADIVSLAVQLWEARMSRVDHRHGAAETSPMKVEGKLFDAVRALKNTPAKPTPPPNLETRDGKTTATPKAPPPACARCAQYEETINKLMAPMSPEEAQLAYDRAVPEPMSEEEIQTVVRNVLHPEDRPKCPRCARLWEAFEMYAGHSPMCHFQPKPPCPCTCGFSETEAALRPAGERGGDDG